MDNYQQKQNKSNMSSRNSPNIFALVVEQDNQDFDDEYFDCNDGRSTDLPATPVSPHQLMASQHLYMGKTGGAEPPQRCFKCEKCVVPDCLHNDQQDTVCVMCIFGMQCVHLLAASPCKLWSRSDKMELKNTLHGLMEEYTKPLRKLGVDCKNIQGITYAFKEDLSQLSKYEADLDPEQLVAMRAVATIFPTAELLKSSGFRNVRSPHKENVSNTDSTTVDTENTLHLTTGQDQLEVTEQMVQVHNTQNTENVMAAQESQVVNFDNLIGSGQHIVDSGDAFSTQSTAQGNEHISEHFAGIHSNQEQNMQQFASLQGDYEVETPQQNDQEIQILQSPQPTYNTQSAQHLEDLFGGGIAESRQQNLFVFGAMDATDSQQFGTNIDAVQNTNTGIAINTSIQQSIAPNTAAQQSDNGKGTQCSSTTTIVAHQTAVSTGMQGSSAPTMGAQHSTGMQYSGATGTKSQQSAVGTGTQGINNPSVGPQQLAAGSGIQHSGAPGAQLHHGSAPGAQLHHGAALATSVHNSNPNTGMQYNGANNTGTTSVTTRNPITSTLQQTQAQMQAQMQQQ